MHKFFLLSLICLMMIACFSPPKNNRQQAVATQVALGLGYLEEGNRKRARMHLQTALQQSDQDESVLLAMAYLEEQSKEYGLAELYYERAARHHSNSARVHHNYGTFLCLVGRFQQGIEELSIAAQSLNYPNQAQSYENAGICALLIPDASLAKTFFTKALNHNPQLSFSAQKLKALTKN